MHHFLIKFRVEITDEKMFVILTDNLAKFTFKVTYMYIHEHTQTNNLRTIIGHKKNGHVISYKKDSAMST